MSWDSSARGPSWRVLPTVAREVGSGSGPGGGFFSSGSASPGPWESPAREFFRFVWQPIPPREYIPEPPSRLATPLDPSLAPQQDPSASGRRGPIGSMKLLQPLISAAGFGAVLILGSCDGSVSGAAATGNLYIVQCSLGCSSGVGDDPSGGDQVSCSIGNTYQNQEITVLFSEQIDLVSINSASFRVVDASTGTTPQGTFTTDPTDPRRLIFRPSLSFDINGNPSFALLPDRTYQVTIPGVLQNDPPPYIRSISGRPNQNRLLCSVITSEGIVDPVPGSPSAAIYADVKTGVDPNGDPILLRNQLVNGPEDLVDVWSGSRIRIRFNDIMNLASVVNPQTGSAPFIRVEVDQDGDTSTADRTIIGGDYGSPLPSLDPGFTSDPFFQAYVDIANLETYVVFQPDLDLPSSGIGALPRLVTVSIPAAVVDLVGNGVTLENGGGLHSFTPEFVEFGELVIPQAGGEDFLVAGPDEDSNEDYRRSSGAWGGGQLSRGSGGGSGRLGELLIEQGETIELNSDYQVFPLAGRPMDLIGNVDSSLTGGPPNGTLGGFPDEILVTGMVEDPSNLGSLIPGSGFEFSRIRIQTGGSLRIVGKTPARVYSRGPVEIDAGGIINMSGATPGAHNSQTAKTVHPDWDAGSDYAVGDVVFHEAAVDYLDLENSPLPTPVNQYTAIAGSVSTNPIEPGVNPLSATFWELDGMVTPINAANGGDGGLGADRYDFSGASMLGLGANDPLSDAIANPGAVTNGRSGQGIGRTSGLQAIAEGLGAIRYPANYGNGNVTTGTEANPETDIWFNLQLLPEYGNDMRCVSLTIGRVGSGGAYSIDGTTGVSLSEEPTAQFPNVSLSNNPPDNPVGGNSGEVLLAPPNVDNTGYIKRKLDWFVGGANPVDFPAYLRGGSGGGGGGNHPYRTGVSGYNDSSTWACVGISSTFYSWHDHSGARGGFGGGALQLTSGRAITVNGRIDASGGIGGSSIPGSPGDYYQFGMPGGGGSGGVLRLQAPVISLGSAPGAGQPNPGRLDVSGGLGGAAGFSASAGGDGGAGLIWIEDDTGNLTHLGLANRILPDDPLDPQSLNWLGVNSPIAAPRRRPDSLSGSVSCWIRPPGNFFALNFRDDDGINTDPAEMAWNMNVLYISDAGPTVPIPFRGIDVAADVDNQLGGLSWEDFFGSELGPFGEGAENAPIVVRFQGARAMTGLDLNHSDTDGDIHNDPCNLTLTGVHSPIVPGSVSPWVDHPALLNDWAAQFGKPTPNMIRYTILFDHTINLPDGSVDVNGLFCRLKVAGVTGLYIMSDPN